MKNNAALLSEAELLAWTGYSRRADLERLLRNHGVRIIYGRDGRICTTIAAVESALGVRQTSDEPAPTPAFAQ
jgi:hypothetical protein